MSEIVDIITSDGQTFKVLVAVAQMSKTLCGLMEYAGTGGEIPLPQVDGPTFTKVMAWALKHVNDPKQPETEAEAVPGAAKVAEISTEDKEFFEGMTQEQTFQIILAANFLDLKGLLDVCCRTVANSVLGKTPKEIYEMFGVAEELTPEEEAEVRKDNPWLEDN